MKFCPILKTQCKEAECAWWFSEENICAINKIANSNGHMMEKMEAIIQELS